MLAGNRLKICVSASSQISTTLGARLNLMTKIMTKENFKIQMLAGNRLKIPVSASSQIRKNLLFIVVQVLQNKNYQPHFLKNLNHCAYIPRESDLPPQCRVAGTYVRIQIFVDLHTTPIMYVQCTYLSVATYLSTYLFFGDLPNRQINFQSYFCKQHYG